MSGKRISAAMVKALQNIHDGKSPWAHLRGASEHGGFHSTMAALNTRKLIARKLIAGEGYTPYEITNLGRAELAKATQPKGPQS